MGLFKKDRLASEIIQEYVDEQKRIEEFEELPPYKIYRIWDIEKAEFYYAIFEKQARSFSWQPVYRKEIARGDKAWADRNAEHFSVNIEDIEYSIEKLIS